jgi:RNA polymerase sigma factor for flagellar operon FliA
MDTVRNRTVATHAAIPIFIKFDLDQYEDRETGPSRGPMQIGKDDHSPHRPVDENTLIRDNLPLVRKIAGSLRRQLPPNMEYDDLLQAGTVGLLEALRGFDPDRGVAFNTYANVRIHGAMLDEIRRAVWAPRSVFQKARRIDAATRSLQNESGHRARPNEVARRLGMSVDQFDELAREARFREFCQIDNVPESGWESAERTPPEVVEEERFTDDLVHAIDLLPERERTILTMYYEQDMKLHEIGDTIGLTESRVCQLHKQAVVHIREQLGDWSGAAA